MPISVQYQPPLQQIADAAQIAGLGDYQRQQDELNLRLAQMAQQGYQFNQQQQFRQQALAAEQQQQAWQNANRNAMLAWQRQNEVADRQQQMGWQDARMVQQRDWELADFNTREKNDFEQMRQAAGFQAATKGGDDVEVEVSKSLAEFGKQRKFLTPEGVNALNGLQSKYRAIQKARDWARPAEYAQAISQFAAEVQQANVAQHVNQPKPLPQRVQDQEGTYTIDEYSPPDPVTGKKTYMGKRTYTEVVRNGVPQLTSKLDKFQPEKPDVNLNATVPTGKGFVEWINKNRKSLEAESGRVNYADARKQYLAELETAKKIEALSLDDAMKELEAQDQEAAKAEEAAQLAASMEFNRMYGGARQSPPAPRQGGRIEGAAQRTLAAYGMGEAPPPPQPQSEEEIRALPKGTRFIAPDGTERVR